MFKLQQEREIWRNNMGKNRTIWIAQTGIFLALLIIGQAITRMFGNQFVAGSVNNMLFILAVILCGLSSAAVLAVISPIIATLLGIGPQLWPLIPAIIIGNLVLIILWRLIALKRPERSKAFDVLALFLAAAAKFLVLYLAIVKLVVPVILGLGEPQASAVSALFSWPQLVTASIGWLLALLVSPALLKAIPRR